MKFIQTLKITVIPLLAIFSCVATSNTALADYLNSEGTGGDYRYELWSSDDNSSYYLKIWRSEASPDSQADITTTSFDSNRDALIFFDCNYAKRNLPECPR